MVCVWVAGRLVPRITTGCGLQGEVGDAKFGFEGNDKMHAVQSVLGVGSVQGDEWGGHVVLEDARDGVVGVVWGALDEVSNVAVACVVLEDILRPYEREMVDECVGVAGGVVMDDGGCERYLLKVWKVGLMVLWWFQFFTGVVADRNSIGEDVPRVKIPLVA